MATFSRFTSLLDVALPAGGSIVLPHGLVDQDVPIRPNLVQPSSGTGLVVTATTATTVTFVNPTAGALSARFMCAMLFSTQSVPGDVPAGSFVWGGVDPSSPDASGILSWTLGTPWATVDAALQALGRMAIVLVEGDPTGAPRLMTTSAIDPAGLTDLGRVVFIGVWPGDPTVPAPGPVIVDWNAAAPEFQIGVGGGLTSRNVLWRYGARIGSGAGPMSRLSFDLDGGGIAPQPGYTGDVTRIGGGLTSQLRLRNGAQIGDAGLAGGMFSVSPAAPAPPVLEVTATSGAVIGPLSFGTSALNPFAPYGIPVTYDGSTQYDVAAHFDASFSIPTLLDSAAQVSFDPALGGVLTATETQAAIDELTSLLPPAGVGGANSSRVRVPPTAAILPTAANGGLGVTYDAYGGTFILTGGGSVLRGQTGPIPVPTAAWAIEAMLIPGWWATNGTSRIGVFMGNAAGANQRSLMWQPAASNMYGASDWTAYVFGSDALFGNYDMTVSGIYIRIRDDLINLFYETSPDGVSWITGGSQVRLALPTVAGIGAWSSSAGVGAAPCVRCCDIRIGTPSGTVIG